MWDIAFSVLHFMAGVHIQLGYTVASYFAEHRWLYILRVSIFITEVFSVHIFPITYKPLEFFNFGMYRVQLQAEHAQHS